MFFFRLIDNLLYSPLPDSSFSLCLLFSRNIISCNLPWEWTRTVDNNRNLSWKSSFPNCFPKLQWFFPQNSFTHKILSALLRKGSNTFFYIAKTSNRSSQTNAKTIKFNRLNLHTQLFLILVEPFILFYFLAPNSKSDCVHFCYFQVLSFPPQKL